MNFIESYGTVMFEGLPVGVVRFSEPLESLSCALLNGGEATVSAAFVAQVDKNYSHPDPHAHAERIRDGLGLPKDTLGMMTAAEVSAVFNVQHAEFGDSAAEAFATAGLSNHVVAGEELDDYDEKSAVSSRRARDLAGTINIGLVSHSPLTMEGRINLFMPLVEAKTAALASRGFAETGTTSDSMAVLCPPGAERVSYSGTGTSLGIASARAVSAAVSYALAARNEHPSPVRPERMLGKMGVDTGRLMAMSGTALPEGEFASELARLLKDPGTSAALDIAWFISKRADSMAEDGDASVRDTVLRAVSDILGAEPPEDGPIMCRIMETIAKKAGGLRWRGAH